MIGSVAGGGAATGGAGGMLGADEGVAAGVGVAWGGVAAGVGVGGAGGVLGADLASVVGADECAGANLVGADEGAGDGFVSAVAGVGEGVGDGMVGEVSGGRTGRGCLGAEAAFRAGAGPLRSANVTTAVAGTATTAAPRSSRAINEAGSERTRVAVRAPCAKAWTLEMNRWSIRAAACPVLDDLARTLRRWRPRPRCPSTWCCPRQPCRSPYLGRKDTHRRSRKLGRTADRVVCSSARGNHTAEVTNRFGGIELVDTALPRPDRPGIVTSGPRTMTSSPTFSKQRLSPRPKPEQWVKPTA
jgi:hypothetical protein